MAVPTLTNRDLVLDLDSTLIHTDFDVKIFDKLQIYTNPAHAHLRDRVYRFDLVDVMTPEGTGKVTKLWGIFRPHVFEFMFFAKIYFERIHIWSAGQHKYVHAIVELLFQGANNWALNKMKAGDPDYFRLLASLNKKPAVIYTYEHCDIDTAKGIINKPLSKMGATESTTLTLDDREDTFALNPGSGILIPAYEPLKTPEGIAKNDIALMQLISWLSLSMVVWAPDVREIDKNGIFETSLEEYKQLLSQ